MMDYEPLIERLLDGTISDVERAALEQHMSASPDVAREVHSLLEVERLLQETAREEDIYSLAFRESVRSELKSSLGFTSQQTSSSPFALHSIQQAQPTGLWSKHWPNALAALLTTLAVVVVLLPDGSSSSPAQQHVATPPSLQHRAEATSQPLATNTPEQALPEKKAVQRAPKQGAEQQTRPQSASSSAAQTHRQASPAQPPPSNELLGTINQASSKEKQYKQAIEDAVQRLNATNDKAASAITAKHLALLHERVGDMQAARTYFEKARQYAHDAGVMEAKGEITGEYALFEQRLGNAAKAQSLATESLNVLRSVQSTRLSAWERNLSPLLR